MKPFINRTAIRKMGFRSAGVSVLAYTTHQVKDEGIYFGKVYQKANLVDEFLITCSEECREKQVNINLSDFNFTRISERGQKTFEVSKGGYMLLYDSKFNNDYHIRLDKSSKGKRNKKEFDTKTLREGDYYAVTLLRPGEYQGYNTKNKSKFQVLVLYPDSKKINTSNEIKPPVNIDVNEAGFYPMSVKITPGQGLVFKIQTLSNLEMNLKEGYEKKREIEEEIKKDNKSKKIHRRLRWVNLNKSKRK